MTVADPAMRIIPDQEMKDLIAIMNSQLVNGDGDMLSNIDDINTFPFPFTDKQLYQAALSKYSGSCGLDYFHNIEIDFGT